MHYLIKSIKDEVTLEPSEFCDRWVRSARPGDRGYRAECIKLLAQATGLSERTIENWGKDFQDRPDYVLTTLRKDSALRAIQQALEIEASNFLPEPSELEQLIEPWDYCLCWLKHIHPDDYGFRAECVRELVRATFGLYKINTINKGWGAKFERRPEDALPLIKIAHAIRSIQQKLRNSNPVTAHSNIKEILQILDRLLPSA